jgi:RHS repeat-associated protein
VVIDDSYDYDANGNVAAISDGLPGQPGNRDMAYDELDRLVSVIAGAAQGGNGSFAYDPLDNLRVLDQGSRQFRYHYDADNRLAQIKSPTGALLHSFGYDARGNTTSKDSGTLTLDLENRLTESRLPGYQSYVYDGLARRVRERADATSTYFYYSQEGKLLYTNDLKTSTRTDHIYLSGSLVAARKVPFAGGSTEVTYQHTDALGTPVAFTDAAGNVTRRERMTAWGEPADGTWSNEPGYTGHQMDAASKLVYMQQRYYDPAIGSFLSVDPAAADIRTGSNYHRYWYADMNPYKSTDPDGRRACSPYASGGGPGSLLQVGSRSCPAPAPFPERWRKTRFSDHHLAGRSGNGRTKNDWDVDDFTTKEKTILAEIVADSAGISLDGTDFTIGGPGTKRSYVTVGGEVGLAEAAFNTRSALVSTIAHEITVHYHSQIVPNRYRLPGTVRGEALWEIEAYRYNIENADRFGNTKEEIDNFYKRLAEYEALAR